VIEDLRKTFRVKLDDLREKELKAARRVSTSLTIHADAHAEGHPRIAQLERQVAKVVDAYAGRVQNRIDRSAARASPPATSAPTVDEFVSAAPTSAPVQTREEPSREQPPTLPALTPTGVLEPKESAKSVEATPTNRDMLHRPAREILEAFGVGQLLSEISDALSRGDLEKLRTAEHVLDELVALEPSKRESLQPFVRAVHREVLWKTPQPAPSIELDSAELDSLIGKHAASPSDLDVFAARRFFARLCARNNLDPSAPPAQLKPVLDRIAGMERQHKEAWARGLSQNADSALQVAFKPLPGGKDANLYDNLGNLERARDAVLAARDGVGPDSKERRQLTKLLFYLDDRYSHCLAQGGLSRFADPQSDPIAWLTDLRRAAGYAARDRWERLEAVKSYIEDALTRHPYHMIELESLLSDLNVDLAQRNR
jgi:hypothetical protein